jgi:tetratricopeptide (TPR) repeat protein
MKMAQQGSAEERVGIMAIAESDARTLLDQFPGLSQITNVYRLLAYAALERQPAQYRAAADFLIQLRDQSRESQDFAELNRLIGDCYFLNRDFANAVDFYSAALSRGLGSPA